MKVALLDIETSPHVVYAWGLWDQNIAPNQVVEPGKTICFAAKWLHEGRTFFHSTMDGEYEMVKAAHDLLSEADAVVHFNGTKFDIPILNKEFLLHGLEPPSSYTEIDLIKVVRSRFKFPSNSLNYVASNLNLGCKTPHKGMDLWRECMAGNEKSWKLMRRYNIQDVNLLLKLYRRLLPWIKNHPNWGLFVDSDRPTCRNCGSNRVKKDGMQYNRTARYQRYRCTSCGTPLRSRTQDARPRAGVLV